MDRDKTDTAHPTETGMHFSQTLTHSPARNTSSSLQTLQTTDKHLLTPTLFGAHNMNAWIWYVMLFQFLFLCFVTNEPLNNEWVRYGRATKKTRGRTEEEGGRRSEDRIESTEMDGWIENGYMENGDG